MTTLQKTLSAAAGTIWCNMVQHGTNYRNSGKGADMAITYQQFINNHNGRGVDYDGAYGVQCVDLIKAYLKEVFNITPGAWGNAHAYYDNFYSIPGLYKNFTRITNTKSFVPQKGDIGVWHKGNGFAVGHVAICDGVGDTSYFYSYDQNWTGNHDKCTRIKHNYYMFAGVLRPKNQTNVNGAGSGAVVANATSTSYKVKITAGRLNVRSGAGMTYKVTTQVKQNEIYTIVATQGGWGKLKSGAGWISLTYTVKV